MVLRRALVTAPLAVLVALAAHTAAFGADHAFGGSYAAAVLAAGVGGALILGTLGLVWVSLAESQAGRAEGRLGALLPARGSILPAAVMLAVSGFAALAIGETIEGRALAGTVAALPALAFAAFIVAFTAKRIVYWLARGGVALAALLDLRLGSAPPARFLAFAAAPIARRTGSRGTRRGRAPPPF